ncbi:MAG TPA: hypothetical protein VK338_03735, partial [Candidatus Nitrosocosmicus sp.]|nr:hypothetical protein [Candidatus Nitrosocosmicus sp.]
QQMREAAGIVEKVTGTLDQISIFSETEQSPYKLLVENVPHEAEIIQKAHDIMQLPPPSEADNRTGTDVKSQKEIAMFKDLQQKPHTGGDVLFALNVATTIHGREYGMDMLWEMIQRGDLKDAGLLPISEKQINWCLKHRLDPRTLAIAIYARTIAMDILKGSTLLENPQDGFFEALSSEQMQQRIENLDKLMPNVGIITALAGTETGSPPSLIPIEGVAIQDVNALVNIGSSPIYNQFNLSPGQYPSAPNNMNVLTQKWQNATKLPYYTYRYNLPGSQRGDGDDSGGAFSEQIMPSLKRAIAQKFETINAKLGYRYPNLGPLDPVSQLVSMNLYLSGEWYLRQGQPDGSDAIAYDAVKGGYIAGDIERMKKAIFGWNGKLDQRDLVIGLGVDYYNQIIAEINSTNP